MRSKRKHERDGEGTKFTLDRKIFSSDIWYASPWKLKIWIYLIGHANHKDSTVMGISVKRGQLIRSYRKIVEDCSYKVGFRTKKPSLDTIKGVCDALEREGRIVRGKVPVRIERKNARRTERNVTLFTVCNYNDLQAFPKARTEQQTPVRIEQDKNVFKVSKDTLRSKETSGFQKFDSGPRRKGEAEHEAGRSPSSGGEKGGRPSPRKTGKSSEPNPDVRVFIDEWRDVWAGKFGERYTPSWEKEGSLVKKLLGIHSLQELRELRKEFFRSDDPFIQSTDYSIGVFYSQINKLVKARQCDPIEEAKREMAKLKEEDEREKQPWRH